MYICIEIYLSPEKLVEGCRLDLCHCEYLCCIVVAVKLQCCCSVAECGSVLQCVRENSRGLLTGRMTVLQCCCIVLQSVAECCNVLQCVAMCCSGLQWVAVWCNLLWCSVLQHVAGKKTLETEQHSDKRKILTFSSKMCCALAQEARHPAFSTLPCTNVEQLGPKIMYIYMCVYIYMIIYTYIYIFIYIYICICI